MKQDGIKRLQQLMRDYDIPIEAVQDVVNRLGWHFISGGQATDDYVWNQVRFFENLIKLGFAKEKEEQSCTR